MEELCSLGSDPNYVCSKTSTKSTEANGTATIEAGRSATTPVGNEAGSSDEEEDDDEDTTATASAMIVNKTTNQSDTKTPVPLVDYILNVVSETFSN